MKNTEKLSSIFYTLLGVGVVGIIGMSIVLHEIVKYGLAWLLYCTGDLISRTIMRMGMGYSMYNKVMIWSNRLDTQDRIWKPTEYCVDCAGKHQKKH